MCSGGGEARERQPRLAERCRLTAIHRQATFADSLIRQCRAVRFWPARVLWRELWGERWSRMDLFGWGVADYFALEGRVEWLAVWEAGSPPGSRFHQEAVP